MMSDCVTGTFYQVWVFNTNMAVYISQHLYHILNSFLCFYIRPKIMSLTTIFYWEMNASIFIYDKMLEISLIMLSLVDVRLFLPILI